VSGALARRQAPKLSDIWRPELANKVNAVIKAAQYHLRSAVLPTRWPYRAVRLSSRLCSEPMATRCALRWRRDQ
jgi:hypothetical protein